MSENFSFDSARLDEFVHLLARYYRAPRTEMQEVSYTEEVEKEVVEEETVEEEVEEDEGPHAGSFFVMAFSAIAGIVGTMSGYPTTGLMICIPGLAIGLVLVFYWRREEKKTVLRTQEKPKTVIEEVERTSTFEKKVTSTKRVIGASRGVLSFDAIDTPAGLVVSGPDILNTNYDFSFPTIENPEEVYDQTEDVKEEVAEIPWVLDGSADTYETAEETNYEGTVPLRGEERTLQEYFQHIDESFEDIRTRQLLITALEDPSLFPKLFSQMEQPESSVEANPKLRECLRGRGGTELEQFARRWETRWTRINLALLQARSTSLFDKVGPECYDLGAQLDYGAFNFYCPFCNEEQQEELLDRDYGLHSSSDHEPIEYSSNTRCAFLPESRTWRCRTCERETENPIPIHRMLDEVLLPAYDQLMQENKNERLRIYSKARDKERELRERAQSEIDKMRHEHMKDMFELSEEMERLQADVRGEREAIRSMENVVDSFRASQEETKEGIVEAVERSLRETQKRKKNVERSLDSFKEKVQKEMTKNVVQYSKTERKEQLKRDKMQRKMVEGIKNIEENTEKIKEGVDEINEGIGDLQEEAKKRRANQRKMMEEMGVDKDDESWITHAGQKFKKKVEETKSNFLGESSRKKQERKMSVEN